MKYDEEYEEYEEERRYRDQYRDQFEREPYPDIVPCFICNCQMYWESSSPEENICSKCLEYLNTIHSRFDILDL